MKPLVPSFSLSEPNCASARRKNGAGICAMHECTNKMNDKSYYMGFLVCDDCFKPFQEARQQIWNDFDRQTVEIINIAMSCKETK